MLKIDAEIAVDCAKILGYNNCVNTVNTSHAEFNIRYSSLGFLKELGQSYKEMRFYLG